MFSAIRLKKKIKNKRKMSWGALTMTFMLRAVGGSGLQWRIVALKAAWQRRRRYG
jgi:hypothetical protein